MRNAKAAGRFLAACLLVWLTAPASATTNYAFVSVNGDTSATSMVQGDTISWGADCAVGAPLHWIIAVDLNDDSTFDAVNDFVVADLLTADGDTLNGELEGDISGTPDGWYQSGSFPVGIAPQYYIFRCTDLTDSSWSEDGVSVGPMALPPNKITGTITIPGVTAPDPALLNIWVDASSDNEGAGGYWSALSLNTGYYEINIGAAGTGVLHRVGATSLPGYIPPARQEIVPIGTINNVDFAYQIPADSLYGLIQDEDGSPILRSVYTYAYQYSGSANREYEASNGSYVIYFAAGETGQWRASINSDQLVPDYLVPTDYEFDYQGSSFTHTFVCHSTDTSIYGQVTENGGPLSSPLLVQARSSAVGWTEDIADPSSSGTFELSVTSDYPNNWDIYLVDWHENYPIPAGYILEGPPPSAVSIGDTVVLNLIAGKAVSDVISVDAGDPAVPWDQAWINLSDGTRNFSGRPDSTGAFTIYADTGTYNMHLSCDGYLANPSDINVTITSDTTGGFPFTLNWAHTRISGQLTNVSLPLSSPVWIDASTAPWPNGYRTGAQVDSLTGTFEMWVCDGDWTVHAPFINGYVQPGDTGMTVAEYPDTLRTVNFVYDITTGTGEEAGGTTPDEFALGHNYPNPFNADTKITFSLTRAGKVRLDIMDILGRRVTTLVSGVFPAGPGEVVWNGRDAKGREVGSGVYFYRLTSPEGTRTRTMMLLK